MDAEVRFSTKEFGAGMNFSLDTENALHYIASNMSKGKQKSSIQSVTMRPTAEDIALLEKLKAKTGLAQGSVIRLALRRLAESEGLKVA